MGAKESKFEQKRRKSLPKRMEGSLELDLREQGSPRSAPVEDAEQKAKPLEEKASEEYQKEKLKLLWREIELLEKDQDALLEWAQGRVPKGH